MRGRLVGSAVFAAALAVLGVVVMVASGGSAPVAEAQAAECPSVDGFRCLFVAKGTDPSGSDQAFSFQHTNGGSTDNFTLSDGEQAIFVFSDNSPHVITEDVPDGWLLDLIDCRDEVGVEINVELGAARITVSMDAVSDPATSVTCTFRNELEFTPTPSPTETQTQTPTATPTLAATASTTPTSTSTAEAPPATAVPTTATPTGVIVPPSTGNAGMK